MRIMRPALFRFAPLAIGALLVAAFVHIMIILLLPRVASSTAMARLSAGASVNALELLQPVAASHETLPFPFADPAMVTALCRYDIGDGPVRLRIPTGESFLSVALLAPGGKVLLSFTDRAATRRQLNVVLVTAEQQRQLEAQDPDDEPVQELRIRLPETRGVAMIRALALREADKEALAAAMSRSSCKQE
jgi:uncharacterized membrane protein